MGAEAAPRGHCALACHTRGSAPAPQHRMLLPRGAIHSPCPQVPHHLLTKHLPGLTSHSTAPQPLSIAGPTAQEPLPAIKQSIS